MPLKSQSQRRFLWAKHPEIAKRWEKETPKGKKLPDKVGERTAEDILRELEAIQAEVTTAGSIATVAVPLGGVAPGAGGGSIAPWGNVDSKRDKEKFFKRFNKRLAAGKAPQREDFSTAPMYRAAMEPEDEAQLPMLRRPFPAESEAHPEQQTEETHTSVMVAFMAPAHVATKLATYGTPKPQPMEDVHLTLCFLGRLAELSPEQVEAIKRVVQEVASRAKPLQIAVAGSSKFQQSEGNGDSAIFAKVSAPGLEPFQAELADRLEQAGAPVSRRFEYHPHITLGYTPRSYDRPPQVDTSLGWTADRVTVCMGDARVDFPMGVPTAPVGLGESEGGSNDPAIDILFTCWPGKKGQLGPEMDYQEWLSQREAEGQKIESFIRSIRGK